MSPDSQTAELRPEIFLESAGVNLYFLDRVLRAMDMSEAPGRFLEIGCGTGRFARCLADASGWEAFGTERSRAAWELASRRIACSLVDGLVLPFEDECFGLVVAKDVLPMVADKALWFREIFRVLERGGLMLTYLPLDSDFREKPLYGFIPGSEALSRRAYGPSSRILDAIKAAGFSSPEVERLFLGLLRFDIDYVNKHRSGFFNNTDIPEMEFTRHCGLTQAACGITALGASGIRAHYEWERTLVICRKP